MDSAHFVLGAYLGYLWCFVRLLVCAPSGRQRFNVLGALNAITHQLVIVTNDSYITATSVCALLEKIALLGLAMPITVVMDNARYQRCQLVLERAAHLGIEVLFLPTYSPNLNLIERFWKFVPKECLYANYYEHFELFKQAIQNCLAETTGPHKAALSSLLTLAFQTFLSATMRKEIASKEERRQTLLFSFTVEDRKVSRLHSSRVTFINAL